MPIHFTAMNTDLRSILCPDCESFSRRDFLKSTLGTAAAAALGGIPIIGRAAEVGGRRGR